MLSRIGCIRRFSLSLWEKNAPLARLIEINNYEGAKKWFEDGNILERNSEAIIYASYFNAGDIVILLADKGLDIETSDDIGRTPIELAAINSNHELIKSLLERGAYTVGDPYGYAVRPAPLHYILENTWNVLGDIPELEKHIETAEILKESYDKDSTVEFDMHTQTKEKHRIMLHRVENGFQNIYDEGNTFYEGGLPRVSFLEEMKRFNNTK